MKILISKKKFIYLAIVLLLAAVSSVILGLLDQNNMNTLKTAIIIQFSLFIILFVLLGVINKSFITLYSVFLIVFYIFQNGQLLLYSFNVGLDYYSYFYVEKFAVDEVYDSVYFSNLCMFSAFTAAIFSFDERTGYFAKKINTFTPKFIYSTATIGLTFTGIVTAILTIIKIIVWTGGRYSGVIAFEAVVPSIIGAIEALFPAFCILAIISGVKSGLKVRLIVCLFLLWGILTALIGDRSTGIGAIVIVLLMYYYGLFSSLEMLNKRVFYIGILFCFWLISFAFSFRNQEHFTFISFFAVIFDVVYELGFSFFPLVAIMNMCPTPNGFLYGSSMLSSIITGYFPESLDVVGLFSPMADQASIPTQWIADRYQYGFGMDCSLNAEVYANFGMYGFLAMFIICAFVATALKKVNYCSNQNIFSQYTGLALLFGWFTLPRRRSYYIYNKIFWYVIVIAAFLGIMYWISKKRGAYAKSE